MRDADATARSRRTASTRTYKVSAHLGARLHRATRSQMEVAPSDRCWRVPRVIGPVDQRQASSRQITRAARPRRVQVRRPSPSAEDVIELLEAMSKARG
jgi:hypothetical protein